jgi:hypothetical protein
LERNVLARIRLKLEIGRLNSINNIIVIDINTNKIAAKGMEKAGTYVAFSHL